jgi:hypothetical protein
MYPIEATPFFPSVYFSRIYEVNAINKSYPDLSRGYNCFSNIPQILGGLGTTAISWSNVEMIFGANPGFLVSFDISPQASHYTMTDLMYMLQVDFATGTFVSFLSASFPELLMVGGSFTISPTSDVNTQVTVSIPKLEYVNTTLAIQTAVYPIVSFPELLAVGSSIVIQPSQTSSTDVVSLSFPKLKSVPIFNLGASSPNLTSLSFPVIEFALGFYITEASSLTSFQLPSTLKYLGDSFNMPAPLDEASVDNILVRLAALDGANGTFVYENLTVTLNYTGASSPSATGLVAKTILESRGCTVNVN